MRKLSEIKNEEAIDLLADLIEPASEIFTDTEVVTKIRNGTNKLLVARVILKNHKKSLLEILATINGVTVEEYEGTAVSIIKDVIELCNDKELLDFLSIQE